MWVFRVGIDRSSSSLVVSLPYSKSFTSVTERRTLYCFLSELIVPSYVVSSTLTYHYFFLQYQIFQVLHPYKRLVFHLSTVTSTFEDFSVFFLFFRWFLLTRVGTVPPGIYSKHTWNFACPCMCVRVYVSKKKRVELRIFFLSVVLSLVLSLQYCKICVHLNSKNIWFTVTSWPISWNVSFRSWRLKVSLVQVFIVPRYPYPSTLVPRSGTHSFVLGSFLTSDLTSSTGSLCLLFVTFI